MPVSPPKILTSALLEAWPWLTHGFSTRLNAEPRGARPRQESLDFDLSAAGPGAAANRKRFAAALSRGRGRALPLTVLRQIHGSGIWPADAVGGGGDALITDLPGRLLAVRTADCVPILLADGHTHAIAAVHAGWRGTALRIAEKAVGEMRAAFQTDPARLRAVIGPSIRACCYEVGAEVREAFAARFHDFQDLFTDNEDDPLRNRYPVMFMTGAPPGHPYDPRWNRETPMRLDLAEANRRQLLAAGVAAAAIDVLPYCTCCRADLFFSHRRDSHAAPAAATGRMLSAIAIASSPLTKP